MSGETPVTVTVTARGRGRPRKYPEKEKKAEEENPEREKRGRGRPKKYPAKETEEGHDPEKARGRGRGRPKKYTEKENYPEHEGIERVRGRGRPRKNPIGNCTVRTSTRIAQSPSESEEQSPAQSSDRAVEDHTPLILTSTPPDSQKERWHLRSMWELASVLNFLHVFRPILNMNMEFSAEELETALITPNNTLSQLHIHLLKGIPPVSRPALASDTWVTVLCKKLADWWPWVAEGELPLVASHGEEIAAYKELNPGTRLLILKALCEIRVEQDDIWKFIDDSIKHNHQVSTFRKVRIGGDAHGTSFWYEGDSTIGHRLYREIRKIEVKQKAKGKGRSSQPVITCQWETIATNLDEFQAVSGKLASSKNKVEAGIGKKVMNDIVPVLEELQKKKERALKKQQRQAILLDSFLSAHGETTGRSRRDRKPVKYTFDDYDRSIDEAIQVTKSRTSPERVVRRDVMREENPEANGHSNNADDAPSSESKDGSGESDAPHTSDPLTRRLRPRTQRYSDRKYMEAVSDEDEIFVEAVYDDGHIANQNHRNTSSGSDGDEEYREDEEDDDEDDEDASINDDSEDSQDERRPSSRRKRINDDDDDDDDSQDLRRHSTRRKRRGQSVDELQSGLRRSKRATRVDYSKYEMSNSEEENSQDSEKQDRPNGRKQMSKMESDVSNSIDCNMESEGSLDNVSDQPGDTKQPNTEEARLHEASAEEPLTNSWECFGEQSLDVKSRHFIDLNEAAPLTGYEDDSSNGIRNETEPEDNRYDQAQNSENDDPC